MQLIHIEGLPGFHLMLFALKITLLAEALAALPPLNLCCLFNLSLLFYFHSHPVLFWMYSVLAGYNSLVFKYSLDTCRRV